MTDQSATDVQFGRPFVLVRATDVSGVSGTGIVANGIQWPDGQAAIHWTGSAYPTTTPHPGGMESVTAVHGHGGATRVVWEPNAIPQAEYSSVWPELVGWVQAAHEDGEQIDPAQLLEYLRELKHRALAPAREWMAGIRDAARQAAGQPAAAVEETHIVADASDDPEHVDDCPGCETSADHDEHCPTPETHNWGCGCPTDKLPGRRVEEAVTILHEAMDSGVKDPVIRQKLIGQLVSACRHVDELRAAGQPDTQQQTDRAQTADPTAAIEIWARLLCAADAHVYGPEHPTWQSLSSDKLRDDYRKAARWLLPRMTVDRCSGAERAAGLREAADEIERRQNQLDAEIHAEYGELDRDTEIEGAATRAMAARLRRMADEATQ